MTCTPKFIWGKMGKEAYNRRAKVKGTTFWEWKQTRISFDEWVRTMESPSLRNHMEIIHRVGVEQTREVDTRGGGGGI